MLEIESVQSPEPPEASEPQYQVMFRFLTFSARPETDGRAVETHLLTSLAIALRSMEPSPQ